MFVKKFNRWFSHFQQQAKIQQHRQLVVLAGQKSWAVSLLASMNKVVITSQNKQQHKTKRWFVFSEDPIFLELASTEFIQYKQLSHKNFRQQLGSECEYLLFDDPHLNIDAFAALSGTICAGGVLFLVFNNTLNNLATTASLFMQRFLQLLMVDKKVTIIQEGQANQLLEFTPSQAINAINANDKILPLGCLTQEQFTAVTAIEKVFSGHRDRPLVLTADRGRGKSSALAIACAHLLKTSKQPLSIIIIAPHRMALNVFFQQLQTSLPEAKVNANKLSYQLSYQLNDKFQEQFREPLGYQQTTKISSIQFLPIDVFIKTKPKASLVLVDEAAAIPIYLLTKIVTTYHRLVFSTTLHGYEGAGRGFSIKFLKLLQEQRPQYQSLHIHQPIRWAEDDPVEKFVFSSGLLNAKLQPLLLPTGEPSLMYAQLQFEQLDKRSLLKNEGLLGEVFSVLVTAHYQTSPSDLKLMLDNENISIVTLSYQTHIVAVALLIKEGECEQGEATAIEKAQRRLKDQFLPQSLINYCGFKQAFNFSYLRIMRIAVHPNFQQHGLGSMLLKKITTLASIAKIDFVGTSFGANVQLLKFWLLDDFKIARIGFTQDQASGEHSIMLLKALSDRNKTIVLEINHWFYQNFNYLLSDEYQQLSSTLVRTILSECPKKALINLTAKDKEMVDAFANKTRLYSSCVYSLHLWLLQQLSGLTLTQGLIDNEVLPLIGKILQKHSIEQLCDQYKISGKKSFNQQLIDYVKGHTKINS